MKPTFNLKQKHSRRNLKPGRNPYTQAVDGHSGLYVGYRVNELSRTWVAKRYMGSGKYEWFPGGIGEADDASSSDGATVFSFDEAVNKAVEWFQRSKDLDRHGIPTNTRYTVEQCVLDYVGDKENEKRKKLDRTRAMITAHIIPALGSIELKELTHGKLKAWRDSLAKAQPRRGYVKGKAGGRKAKAGRLRSIAPLSADDAAEYQRKRQSTANRILTVLKAALNWSLQEKRQFIRDDSAWKHVKPFKSVDAAKIRFLSDDELKRFIPAIANDAFCKLVKGALFTGARLGELVRLQVKDFSASEGKGTVFIAKSKNGEARHIFLNPEAATWFASIVKGLKPTDKVFTKEDGTTWNQSEQFRPMKAACEAASVEGVSFHILRHTYASHALMKGMDLPTLQKQLGHKSITITIKHYGHLSESYRQAQVEQFAPSYNFV